MTKLKLFAIGFLVGAGIACVLHLVSNFNDDSEKMLKTGKYSISPPVMITGDF